MRFKFNKVIPPFLTVALAMLMPMTARAGSDEMKLDAKLIWGTNEEKSPDPKHKPVSPELADKLKNSPFKWKYYFEVKSECFTLPKSEEKTISMSKTCEVRIKNLGDSEVELRLFGKGKQVSKTTQPLPRGELLVTGGNAENATAWFVVLKRGE